MLIDPTKSLKLPAEECVLCGKTLDKVGGKRITSTQVLGVTHLDEPRQGGEYRNHSLGSDLGYVITWGDGWNVDAVARAVDAYQAGLRPWMCQICARRACGICGAPMALPMAAEILHDDGDVRHHMIVPLARIPCVNPECSEFRPAPV